MSAETIFNWHPLIGDGDGCELFASARLNVRNISSWNIISNVYPLDAKPQYKGWKVESENLVHWQIIKSSRLKSRGYRKSFLDGNQNIIKKHVQACQVWRYSDPLDLHSASVYVACLHVHHLAIITSNQVLSQRGSINQSHPSHRWNDTWPVDIRGVSQLLLETICLKQWTNYHLNVSKALLFICWKFMVN